MFHIKNVQQKMKTYFLMKTRFNRFLKVIGIQKKIPISFGEKKQEMKGYKFISHYTKFITYESINIEYFIIQ